jgi:hypothetical protein
MANNTLIIIIVIIFFVFGGLGIAYAVDDNFKWTVDKALGTNINCDAEFTNEGDCVDEKQKQVYKIKTKSANDGTECLYDDGYVREIDCGDGGGGETTSAPETSSPGETSAPGETIRMLHSPLSTGDQFIKYGSSEATLIGKHNKTEAECKQLCLDNPECNHARYYTLGSLSGGNNCVLIKVDNNSNLYTLSDNSKPNYEMNLYDKVSVPDNHQGFLYLEHPITVDKLKKYIKYFEIGRTADVSNENECKEVCDSDANCKYYRYYIRKPSSTSINYNCIANYSAFDTSEAESSRWKIKNVLKYDIS